MAVLPSGRGADVISGRVPRVSALTNRAGPAASGPAGSAERGPSPVQATVSGVPDAVRVAEPLPRPRGLEADPGRDVAAAAQVLNVGGGDVPVPAPVGRYQQPGSPGAVPARRFGSDGDGVRAGRRDQAAR